MRKWMLSAVLVTSIGSPFSAATAQIKIMTPNSDSCAAFSSALSGGDQRLLLTLGAWATGYLSGVAQGTGIDFLRDVEPGNASVFLALDAECRKRPNALLSVTLEDMSRNMIAAHRAKR